MATFFELLSGPAFQRAIAETRIRQEGGGARGTPLAVQPRPSLAPLVEGGLRRQVAGQSLATERRRTDLAEDRFKFERRQAPFAIGIGALTAGAGFLGGVRSLQAQEARAKQMGILQGILGESAARRREQTAARLASDERRRQMIQRSTAADRFSLPDDELSAQPVMTRPAPIQTPLLDF